MRGTWTRVSWGGRVVPQEGKTAGILLLTLPVAALSSNAALAFACRNMRATALFNLTTSFGGKRTSGRQVVGSIERGGLGPWGCMLRSGAGLDDFGLGRTHGV